MFFGPIKKKTRWPPWHLIGWYIFDFSSETAKRNSTKLDRKKDFNVLYYVCVFGPIGKTRWPPWPLIGWYIFDSSSASIISKHRALRFAPLPHPPPPLPHPCNRTDFNIFEQEAQRATYRTMCHLFDTRSAKVAICVYSSVRKTQPW